MPKPTRRVIADHDKDGKAIITEDRHAPNMKSREATGITSTVLWATHSTPADAAVSDDPSLSHANVAPPQNGSVLRIVEFPPVKNGGAGVDNEAMLKEMGISHAPGAPKPRNPFMHRTRSVDYAIILEGEIDMLLDDSEVHLKAGDVLIQKATNHAWVNNSDKPCRICFVLIDAHEPPAWAKNPSAH
ncbi:MAG: cupin domain-containing protein [Alphaproteobacteria bacterium]|nr:cupin domain-containing protein [Alphaproteobacteria bacterium]